MNRSESNLPLRVYRPLPLFGDRKQIEEVLCHGSTEELLILPLALGEHCQNWKYAQDICLRLAEHSDPAIRANACLGLAYIARTKQRLEKHLVKPILLRELRYQTELRWRIEDAIKDVNRCLGWCLTNKHEDK